jgi:hypothetical protein
MNTLRLTLKQPYFDQIKMGTKVIEYRDVKPYWTSRLYDKQGKVRVYDRVEFIIGYNPDSLRMITEFKGVRKRLNTYEISLGKVIKIYRKVSQ